MGVKGRAPRRTPFKPHKTPLEDNRLKEKLVNTKINISLRNIDILKTKIKRKKKGEIIL